MDYRTLGTEPEVLYELTVTVQTGLCRGRCMACCARPNKITGVSNQSRTVNLLGMFGCDGYRLWWGCCWYACMEDTLLTGTNEPTTTTTGMTHNWGLFGSDNWAVSFWRACIERVYNTALCLITWEDSSQNMWWLLYVQQMKCCCCCTFNRCCCWWCELQGGFGDIGQSIKPLGFYY